MENTNKWLLIENKGEIDVNALTLMGGSTKRDSTTSIGFFGSGNKYAIALLLKAKIGLRIFAGEKEMILSTEPINFRDKSFEKILIDGRETSLTTDMGPQWSTWMAIREFVSNAIDEGENNVVACTESLSGKSGYTRFYIQHVPDIVKVINEWDEYFSFDRTDAIIDIPAGKLFPNISEGGRTRILYRRGIRCYDAGEAMYHYDLPDFVINESRVVENIYVARRSIRNFLIEFATKEVAKNILEYAFREGNGNFVESHIEYHESFKNLNPAWKEAIGKRVVINEDLGGFYQDRLKEPHLLVSKSMAKKIKDSFPEIEVCGVGSDTETYTIPVEMTAKMNYQLKRAVESLKEMKYELSFPIQVVTFSKASVLGLAKDNTIYISNKLFDKGIREIAITLMEENEHLVTKHEDCTRDFQNHLFNKWISVLEEQHGIFL
jgi:hypothetical protein